MITDQSAFADKVDGGVQAVTKYLVDAITRAELVELHVVCLDKNTRTSSVTEENGFKRHVLPASRFGTSTAFLKDQQSVNACLRRIAPDVVHGQGAGRNGILAARSPFPSVITIHGILAEEAQFFPGFKRRAQHHVLSALSSHYCIRKATHTILISPYVADHYARKLGGQKYLVPNPIADEFFKVCRNPEAGRVLFAGRLLPLKGVMELVRAAALLANTQPIQLELAGSLKQDRFVSKLREEVAALSLTDVVHFRGLLNVQEMRVELERCAMLVLPSYQETAPMVVAEAMAAGVPVVASDVGGVRYQIDHGKNGYLVEPGDVEGLAEKMDRLLSNLDIVDAFGKNAKESAADRYSAQKVAQQTIDVYSSITSTAGHARRRH